MSRQEEKKQRKFDLTFCFRLQRVLANRWNNHILILKKTIVVKIKEEKRILTNEKHEWLKEMRRTHPNELRRKRLRGIICEENGQVELYGFSIFLRNLLFCYLTGT